MGIKQIIIKRAKEPSTWAGVGTLAVLFGAPAGAAEAVGQIVAGLCALVSIIMPEGGGDA